MTTKELTEAQMGMLIKVEKALAALNFPYAIRLPNGVTRGMLPVKGHTKRPLEFPWGEIKAYTAPLVEGIEVGEKRVISADKYGEARVRSSAHSIMVAKHGKDMATCTANGDGTVTVDFNCGLPS